MSPYFDTLDALIAKNRGWTEIECRPDSGTCLGRGLIGIDPAWEKRHGKSPTGYVPKMCIKFYTSDIRDAWELVELTGMTIMFSKKESQWRASLDPNSIFTDQAAKAPSAPLAIGYAFLIENHIDLKTLLSAELIRQTL